MQQTGSEGREELCIPYHSYLIPENLDLLNATCFLYRESLVLGSENDVVALQRNLDQHMRDSTGDADLEEGLDNGCYSEKS